MTKKRGIAQSSSIGKIVKEQSAENSHPITISTDAHLVIEVILTAHIETL